jgi:hypothetical protein
LQLSQRLVCRFQTCSNQNPFLLDGLLSFRVGLLTHSLRAPLPFLFVCRSLRFASCTQCIWPATANLGCHQSDSHSVTCEVFASSLVEQHKTMVSVSVTLPTQFESTGILGFAPEEVCRLWTLHDNRLCNDAATSFLLDRALCTCSRETCNGVSNNRVITATNAGCLD